MRQRPLWPLLPPVVVVGAMYLFLAFVHRMQSSERAAGVVCIVHEWTGLYCPGCGGTRCAEAITTGHWFTAMDYNPLLMTGFLLFLVGSTYLIVRLTILGKPAPNIPDIPTYWIWLGIGGIVLFTILRNLPFYPFSLLAP
ncbi:MAG: DUF2752 domain-containing protein [Verrucomicrobiae bacterium]|nr:DUF2752 domain-containing protein [Verrucomicrobiae bacterium]NNJ85776.1 DUF2752 domain-containing protein [Akkermansiaceae bacterium]